MDSDSNTDSGADCHSDTSPNPVRYSTGQLVYSQLDLAANAFGIPWSHSRSLSNSLAPVDGDINGNSWLVGELRSLLFVGVGFGYNNPDQICIVIGSTTSLWFLKQSDGITYLPQFNGYDVLVYDAANQQFVWTNPAGRQTTFYDNSSNVSLAGALKAIRDKSGNTVVATYGGGGYSASQLTGIFQEDADGTSSNFEYDYYLSGPNYGLLSYVTLSVNGQPVRRAVYVYYAGEFGGNVNDLKTVSIQQFDSGTNGWLDIRNSYYRYYLPGEANGYPHGLKFILEGASYQVMIEAGLNPATAPDAQLAQFASLYVEYDGLQRVKLEDIQGGRQQYTFAYWASPASPGYDDVNTWANRTIETLPDGSQNRVYTNKGGQILLKILSETSTENQWYSYFEFDENFNQVLQASPAAVSSVIEPTGSSPTLVVNLNAFAGLIETQQFYTSTDLVVGAVQGYLEGQYVQQGSTGAPEQIRGVTYTSQTAAGQTIYPLATTSVFPNGTLVTTSYSYVYYSDPDGNPTFQIQELTTTYPAVGSDQNGSGVAGATKRVNDIYGRQVWAMDTRGAITYFAYDLATGALIQQIDDVNTELMTSVPAGWSKVPGWGLHLITDFVNDSLGRQVQARGPWHDVQLHESDTEATPIRTVQFTAYVDEAHEVLQATGYMTGEDPTANFHTVGAVNVTKSNASGYPIDEIQSVRGCNSGPLAPGEAFPQEKWSRWTHRIYDPWNRLYATRVYCQIPKRGEGDAGANYLETIYGYDVMGRQNRIIQPSGTIQRVIFDARGLPLSNWTGTNDAGATDTNPTGSGTAGNNMVNVSTQHYDLGSSGNGNLTSIYQPVDSNAANDRIVNYRYDYRNRKTATVVSDGTTTWVTLITYDNLDHPLQTSTSVLGGNLIGQSRAYYDDLGRVYRQETDGVNPNTGSVVNTLASQNWYDLGNNAIKASAAGSTAFVKTVFDGLSRPTVSYLGCVPGTAGVPTGDDNDISDDTVFEQVETTYDAANNVLLSTNRKRLDSATGTGALQDVSTEPEARVTFVANWSDAIGRIRNSADFGTNGSAPLSRPDVAPERSDTVLVTTNRFKSDGEANAIIDPMGLEARWDNDNAGRRIRLIENFVEGRVENSRISEYAWHASGQMEKLTLQNSVTGDQITRWIYGTTLSESGVADNNLLRAKIYPESDDQPAPLENGPDGVYDRLEYAYNRQGQVVTLTDADQTTHTYLYDKLGRQASDGVTNLATGLDSSVLRVERSYEVRGMLQTVTSYNAATGGSIVNQSAFTYDAFRNLTTDQQSAAGAVVPGTTPQVGYSYANGSANTVRRTSVTYPNGRIFNTVYGPANSAADHLSQISSLNVTGESADLAEYTYCGTNWQVLVQFPQPGVELTYIRQDGELTGDSGDPYTGYDRFGRSIDIRWQTIGAGASLERLQYGFDRDSRRTWRQRVLATGLDNAYNYDGLSQVTNAAVGNLNLSLTAIGGIPAQTEAWNYDPTGNWSGYATTANGTVTLDQGRVHDKGNRLMQIESDPNPVIVDRVGRMLEVSPDASGEWTQSLTFVWDAWNRITRVSQNGSLLGTYSYDGLARRLTRTVSGVTSHCYYSDSWRPLEERQDAQTTASVQYLWGARHRDDLIRRDRATTNGGSLSETRYVLMDYFSPACITDQRGVVTERYAFSTFGVRTILAPDFSPRTTSESNWMFAFHGQLLDAESGFSDYGYRYYSPSIGRWLSKDPAGEAGGVYLYLFANNSPTGFVDLFGLRPCVSTVWYGDQEDVTSTVFAPLTKMENEGWKGAWPSGNKVGFVCCYATYANQQWDQTQFPGTIIPNMPNITGPIPTLPDSYNALVNAIEAAEDDAEQTCADSSSACQTIEVRAYCAPIQPRYKNLEKSIDATPIFVNPNETATTKQLCSYDNNISCCNGKWELPKVRQRTSKDW